MGLDLGRVQGAGFFHTMAPSGVTVQISSLQPQLTPFLGDGILFSNGDVRQIIGVSGSTVTLGDVLFSVKGEPGIGNATLSNTDGDSTENGFTQAAVKGIAQAKNYYNLGEYDTSVSNGDGTALNPRKTEFFKLDGNDTSWTHDSTWANPHAFISDKPLLIGLYNESTFGDKFIFSNRLTVTSPASIAAGETNSIGAGNGNRIFISIDGCTTSEEINKNLSENPIYIQYRLAPEYQHIEKVIENQPICVLDQNGEWWLREEWGKGLNLFNKASVTKGKYFDSSNNIGVDSKYFISDYISVSANCKYTGYFITEPNNGKIGIRYFDASRNLIDNGLGNFNDIYTITTPNNCDFVRISGFVANIDSVFFYNGDYPRPYIPYYGNIIREKDLSGIQLFPEGVNPAQTIGGDWEDKGMVTTSNNTVFHAYRRL